MELITVTEAARRAGVRREAIYYSIRQGNLNSRKEYGHILVDADEVARYTPRAHPKRRSVKSYGFLAGTSGSVDAFMARKAAEKALER